jgi:hypothetical protein
MSPLEQERVKQGGTQHEPESARDARMAEDRGQLFLPRIPLPVQRPILDLRRIRRIAYI